MSWNIDWLGLTAEITEVIYVVVVDTTGISRVTKVEKVTTIDLVDHILATSGPEEFKRILDLRQVMLSYESFMYDLEDYEERHGEKA